MKELREELIHFLCDKFHVDSENIQDATEFTADLGLNSLQALELLGDVESRFHCRIPECQVYACVRVQDLIKVIQDNSRGAWA